MKFVSSLLGTNVKAPAPSPAPVQAVEEDAKKTKKRASALYATEGGSAGEEVQSVQTSRGNIFGN